MNFRYASSTTKLCFTNGRYASITTYLCFADLFVVTNSQETILHQMIQNCQQTTAQHLSAATNIQYISLAPVRYYKYSVNRITLSDSELSTHNSLPVVRHYYLPKFSLVESIDKNSNLPNSFCVLRL
jgi:hypothetical protein